MRERRHINIPLFIPHKGCPHTCVFCDQRKISGTRLEQSLLTVKELLEDSLSTVEARDDVEIAFFGGSFTGLPEVQMVSYLELARPYVEAGKVQGIRLSTRPDTINDHVLDILQQYGVTTIELGVQSLDEEVLKLSQRGHTSDDTDKACTLIKERGIKLGIQTMLGLPGDSFPKALRTAQGVIRLNPSMVRIYPALVLEGTEMEALYRTGRYTPLSIEEAVNWCAAIVPLYRQAGITLLRIGLHASETLESSVVAGPYHPAFGELVESRILYDKLVEQLDAMEPLKQERLIIRTRSELVSKLVGHKKSNIHAIKNKYDLKEVRILPDLHEGEFMIIRMKEENEGDTGYESNRHSHRY